MYFQRAHHMYYSIKQAVVTKWKFQLNNQKRYILTLKPNSLIKINSNIKKPLQGQYSYFDIFKITKSLTRYLYIT